MTSACTRHRRADLALLALLMAVAGSAAGLESDRDQPMDVAAVSSEMDLNTGVYRLVGAVEIRQGSLLIQADTGEVHQPQSGEVSRVVLEGAPARLEQALDQGAGHMRASARRIDYDRDGESVVLTGGVRIEDPRGTLTGERVTYNIAQGRVQGQSAGGDGRVRFVIPPRARPPGGQDEAETETEVDPDTADGSVRGGGRDADRDAG